MDEYDVMSMFRREVFHVACNHLKSGNLSEPEVAGALKQCIEFFMGGADKTVVRDFCVAKMRQAGEM